MANTDNKLRLSAQETTRVKLIELFSTYGYNKYEMAQFESYEVYLKNKDYIDGTSIVTFTDARGKLLALRPDVTLSIVNNLPSEGRVRKYYYDENVFRRDKAGDYRELHQLGVEYIGGEGQYPECEILLMAVKALANISDVYVLTVGHLAVLDAVLVPLMLAPEVRNRALEFIRAKAFHSLKKLLADVHADESAAQKLIELSSLEGEADDILPKAAKLVKGTPAERSVNELAEAAKVVRAAGFKGFKIDFSLAEDFRYYNGIVFRGYVSGVSAAILSGGRYDNMLARMGRCERAVGFGLDFSLAHGILSANVDYDVMLIGSDAAKLMETAEKLRRDGKRVLVADKDDAAVKAERVFV